MLELTKSEGELDVILTYAILLDNLLPQSLRAFRDIHALEFGVDAHALEERDAVSRSAPSRGAQDTMCCAASRSVIRRMPELERENTPLTDAFCDSLKPLSQRHDQRPIDRRTIDPLASVILYLQAPVVARLQQVTRQHAIFMRSDALRLHVSFDTQFVQIGIFHNLQLVLLVLVVETGESVRR